MLFNLLASLTLAKVEVEAEVKYLVRVVATERQTLLTILDFFHVLYPIIIHFLLSAPQLLDFCPVLFQRSTFWVSYKSFSILLVRFRFELTKWVTFRS